MKIVILLSSCWVCLICLSELEFMVCQARQKKDYVGSDRSAFGTIAQSQTGVVLAQQLDTFTQIQWQ